MEAARFCEQPGAHLSTQVHCSIFNLTALVRFLSEKGESELQVLNLEVLPISIGVLTLSSLLQVTGLLRLTFRHRASFI